VVLQELQEVLDPDAPVAPTRELVRRENAALTPSQDGPEVNPAPLRRIARGQKLKCLHAKIICLSSLICQIVFT
jgi:hypothetical protein